MTEKEQASRVPFPIGNRALDAWAHVYSRSSSVEHSIRLILKFKNVVNDCIIPLSYTRESVPGLLDHLGCRIWPIITCICCPHTQQNKNIGAPPKISAGKSDKVWGSLVKVVSGVLSQQKVAGLIPTISTWLFKPLVRSRRQSLPVWPPTLNKIHFPLPLRWS